MSSLLFNLKPTSTPTHRRIIYLYLSLSNVFSILMIPLQCNWQFQFYIFWSLSSTAAPMSAVWGCSACATGLGVGSRSNSAVARLSTRDQCMVTQKERSRERGPTKGGGICDVATEHCFVLESECATWCVKLNVAIQYMQAGNCCSTRRLLKSQSN